MSSLYPRPSNEDDFELFGLRLLRELWGCQSLQQYGKRGERQDGIDLIDEGGGTPLRAVQCKHHEPEKTIPPAEIEAEVRKALGSSLPIDEYYVLTTARKTTHGQNAVIRINRDHQAAGRFKVFLWTWADIEMRLSELDDAAQDRVLRGDTGRGAPALCRMLTGAVAEHLDRPLYSSASALDAELEAAKSAIDRHHLEVAEHRLGQVESRGHDKLQPYQWYQLKALRSHLHIRHGEWHRAGREFLDAKRFLPATERARVNEALGLELAGERAKAHALTTELRAEFPHSPKLLGVWLRTRPAGAPLHEAESAAAPFLADGDEVNLALAHLALAAGEHTTAEGYARKATEHDSGAPHGWFLLGQALHLRGHLAVKRDRASLLREAEGYYDRAASLAHDQRWVDLEAAVRFNRGGVRWLLGDPRAEGDYLAAVEAGLSDRTHRVNYAAFLVESGRFDDALRELEAVPGEADGKRLFLEAAARYGRNRDDDRTRARSRLLELTTSDPADGWDDAHVLLVKWATEEKDLAAAERALESSKLRDVQPLLFHALQAWLSVAGGDPAAAAASLDAAAAAVSADRDRGHLFLLAQVFALNGDDGRALPLFERCARPGVFDAECRKLLDCAGRLDRHDITVRVCRELREAGETDKRLIETETGLLQRYDPPAALRVAEEYLAGHPDDRHAALWQSWLALRLDRPDLVIRDPGRLPRADEVTPRGSGLVLAVLRDTGQPVAGLRYAYEALREHFDDEHTHGQFIAYFHLWSPHHPQVRVGGTAGPGTAVCYRGEHDEVDRWVVIEEAAEPDPALGEVGPDHHLARALNRHPIGEVVTLVDGGLQPRKATIREAVHKYVYRFRDCMDQFQVRFPGASGCQVIHVGSGDEFDPSPIVQGLEEQRRHIESLDARYRKGPLPLSTFAELAGRNEFDTWAHLTSDPTLGIRCASGEPRDTRDALELARASTTLILDATALVTLAALELLPVLRSDRRQFVVSQSTYERLRDLVDQKEADDREGGRLLLADGGQLAVVETTAEQRERQLNLLRSVRDAVRGHCEVRACPATAALDPSRREKVTTALGQHNLESMLLAAAPDTALWTDDLVVGVVGRTDFGASRVWTQAALFVLTREGVIAQTDYDRATARLVGWHYHSVQCNAETLVAAAEVADWDATRWPVPQVMRTLGDDQANPIDRLGAAAAAVRAVWRRDLPDHVRHGFLFAVLGGIGSVRLIRRLIPAIPGVFSLDVLSADEVVGLMRYWLRHPTGLVRP